MIAATSRISFIFRCASLASLCALGGTAANAASGDLLITTTALPPAVSLTRLAIPGNKGSAYSSSYAAYQVTVTNQGGNTINQVVFGVTATVLDTTNTQVTGDPVGATYVPQAPSSSACTGNADGSSVSCTLGHMAAFQSNTFVLVFTAPTAGAKISLATTATYSESISPGAPPSTITVTDPTVYTALVDPSNDTQVNAEVMSYVPSFGTGVCTGVYCIPSGTNPGTAGIFVPSTPLGGVATIGFATDPNNLSCAGGFPCNVSTVTAPGLFSNLQVTLRRNPAFIAPGQKIAKTPVTYTFDNGTTVDISTNFCTGYSTNNPVPPVAGTDPASTVPCIAKEFAYPNNYKPNPALSGVFEWVIYSLHNGKFSM